MLRLRTHLLSVLLVLLLAGCAPSISALYRDYEDTAGAPDERVSAIQLDRVRRALEASGWETTEGQAGQTLATEARTFRDWGVYRVEVELEVAPMAGDFVRVLVHPYRRYFTGGRGKIPYLKKGLANDVLKPLTAALKEEGLAYAGTKEQRDRQGG